MLRAASAIVPLANGREPFRGPASGDWLIAQGIAIVPD